jgi:hypothetical protein
MVPLLNIGFFLEEEVDHFDPFKYLTGEMQEKWDLNSVNIDSKNLEITRDSIFTETKSSSLSIYWLAFIGHLLAILLTVLIVKLTVRRKIGDGFKNMWPSMGSDRFASMNPSAEIEQSMLARMPKDDIYLPPCLEIMKLIY